VELIFFSFEQPKRKRELAVRRGTNQRESSVANATSSYAALALVRLLLSLCFVRMAQEAVWSAKQFEEWDEFIDEVVNVNGHELRIAKRNLDREDGDWVDPMFFAEDYTVRNMWLNFMKFKLSFPVSNQNTQVAAATGFQVWEGARAVLKLLEDPDTTLSYHIKGKRILELGSGTGLAGLCASVTGI
jgi:hypothetical protein